MSEVINGVPRELLERAERNLCSGEEAYRTQQDLRAVLTAQPQASAAQSAPDEREDWGVFASYLLDKCEGEVISEEMLQYWASEMIADPHYGALFRREKVGAEISPISLAIELAEEEHGSLRTAAKALGIDAGYLSRLKNGEKVNPSDEVLASLGLERVTTYRAAWQRAQSAPPVTGPAERCDACQGLTLGLTGEQKWCCYCGNRLTGDYVESAQSAPAGEREAFEVAVAAVNERGWTTSTDLARQIWDSCAAWQRAQSAPVVPEGWRLVPVEPTDAMLAAYEFHAIAPMGPISVYGYRAMLAAAPQPDQSVDAADMVTARQEQGE